MRWTIPNILTALRLLAAPGLAVMFLYFQRPWADWFALTLFVAAAVTDWFDGYLARRWHATTRWGAILDPIADKVLVTGAILGVLTSGSVPQIAIPCGLILFREFAVSALRETVAGKVKLPVTLLAKWKTTLQLVALGAQLFARNWDGFGLEFEYYPYFQMFADVLIWAAALITLWTGWQYFAKARQKMAHL